MYRKPPDKDDSRRSPTCYLNNTAKSIYNENNQQNKSPSGRSLDNTNVLSPVLGLQCVTADREGGDDLLCVSAGRVRWPNSDTVASLLQLTTGSQPKAVLQSQTQFKDTRTSIKPQHETFMLRLKGGSDHIATKPPHHLDSNAIDVAALYRVDPHQHM